jgi:mannose-6-phosphate isomerase-like protein (cupin superfamily)
MRAGASRRVVTGEFSSVVRVLTEPDAIFDREEHRHPNEQWLVVVRGRLQVVCDGREHDLRAGDVVFFPAHAWHAAVGVGDEGCEYLELSAPGRLDLLPGALVPCPMEFRSHPGGGRR